MESMPKERGRRSWRNVKTYASLPSPVFWLQSSGFWLQSAVFCPSLRLLVSRFANDNDNKMLMAQIIVKQERKTETADCSLEFGVWSLKLGACSWKMPQLKTGSRKQKASQKASASASASLFRSPSPLCLEPHNFRHL